MSSFADINWTQYWETLKLWEQLPEETKTLILEIKSEPENPITEDKFGESKANLQELGLLSETPEEHNRNLVSFAQEHHPFLKLAKALNQHIDLIDTPSEGKLVRYLRRHFTDEECNRLMIAQKLGPGTAQSLAPHMRSQSWPQRFAAHDDLAEWERINMDYRGLSNTRAKNQYYKTPEITTLLKAVISSLLRDPTPMSFETLSQFVSKRNDPLLSEFLTACLHFGILFIWLCPKTKNPYFGLWPEIANRIQRPIPPEPGEQKPKTSFNVPIILYDIARILETSSSSHLAFSQESGSIFKKHNDALVSKLTSIPDWLPENIRNIQARIDQATDLAMRMGLTEPKKIPDYHNQVICITEQGKTWLHSSYNDQFKILFTFLRKNVPPANTFYWNSPFWQYLPGAFNIQVNGKKAANLCPAISEVISGLPENKFFFVNDFIARIERINNPLTTMVRNTDCLTNENFPKGLTDEDAERTWGQIVKRLITEYLPKIGVIHLGISQCGAIVFARSSLSTAYFNQEKEITYSKDTEEACAVVQPNYEIVFLEESPRWDAECARFATRLAQGLGTLFRITRESIWQAKLLGFSSKEILKTLGQISKCPIPENVKNEIVSWTKACRQITPQKAYLIQCPDAMTAQQTILLLKDKVTALNKTTLQYNGDNITQEERKLLESAGIFIA